jgi:hypothetical protein
MAKEIITIAAEAGITRRAIFDARSKLPIRTHKAGRVALRLALHGMLHQDKHGAKLDGHA